MNIEKELITPQVAKEMLKSNTVNRNVRIKVVKRYVDDMLNGRWKENTAELIKISKSGRVLDGQHRLLAVIQANVAFYFYIAYDLEDSVFDVLDTGALRTSSDVFEISGVNNSKTLPSIIQYWNSLKSNVIHRTSTKDAVLTNAQLLDVYHSNPNHWAYITKTARALYNDFQRILQPKMIGGLFALFYDISPKDTGAFMSQLCTGKSITNNTIVVLRNKLIADAMATKKMPYPYKAALIIKTWNCYRSGRELKHLSFNSSTEENPKPI